VSPTEARHRVLFAAQVVVGFGLFGIGSALLTLSLPLLWSLCFFRRERMERVTRACIRAAFSAIFAMTRALGFARLETNFHAQVRGPALLACNHISLFDVLAVIARVPGTFTFVKSSFVRIPLLRYIILSSGFIPVDPASPSQSAEAYARALSRLREGAVFVVFPEGTRSSDGRLGAFHKGVFRLARSAGVPLTPVRFSATGPLVNKRVLKRIDGRPVTLRMEVFPCAAHLAEQEDHLNMSQEGNTSAAGSALEQEMAALRRFFERRGIAIDGGTT
jgi:1-acyl-sn-glycerol-3-phosphate acyltransferase